MTVDGTAIIAASLSGTIVIVVGEFVVSCVIFASILQQTRSSGHNPYRGFIIPSPEMETIPLGLHNDIITQIQSIFSGTIIGEVDDAEVGTVGAVVGVVGGVDGGIVGNVIEGIVDGAVGDVAGGVIPITFVGDVATFIGDVAKGITAVLVTFGR